MTDTQADLTERAREIAKDIRVELMRMVFIHDGRDEELRLPAGHLAVMERHIAAALQSEREAALMDGGEWRTKLAEQIGKTQAATAEARRAAITAARSCAQFKCTMMSDEIPRCPDCGATVEGNDPVNGVCQADVIRQVKADVIEAYFSRALASPPAPQEETR